MKCVFAVMFTAILVFSNSVSIKAEDKMKITVQSVKAEYGEEISVPVMLTDNPGIEAMQLFVEYDEGLSLTKVDRGDALSKLTYTCSGSLSVYPFVLLWDGMQEDSSDGVLVTLHFKVSSDAAGIYNINVYSGKGMVYNHKLEDIDIIFNKGLVDVENTESAYIYEITDVSLMDCNGNEIVSIAPNEEIKLYAEILKKDMHGENGRLFVCVYDTYGSLINLNCTYIENTENGLCSAEIDVPPQQNSIGHIKIFIWDELNSMHALAKSCLLIR